MSLLVAAAGTYAVFEAGIGLVTAQVEGMGMIAGPPALGRIFAVGSADASEQTAAARKVVEVYMVGDEGLVGLISTTEQTVKDAVCGLCRLISLSGRIDGGALGACISISFPSLLDACCCDVNVARANLLRHPSAAPLCAHDYLAHRRSSLPATYGATISRTLHHHTPYPFAL